MKLLQALSIWSSDALNLHLYVKLNRLLPYIHTHEKEMALSAAISVTSDEHLHLSTPSQLHLHLLWPNIWSDSKAEREKETCGILDHLSASRLNRNSPRSSQWCICGFVRRISRSKRALAVLPGSRSSPRRLAVTLLKQQREGRGARGANLFQQREAGGDGSDGLCVCLSGGGVCVCLNVSQSWVVLPWRVPDSISGRESCRREGGVNANRQERQRRYICTSSIQKRRRSLRHTALRTERLFGSHWSQTAFLKREPQRQYRMSWELHENCLGWNRFHNKKQRGPSLLSQFSL